MDREKELNELVDASKQLSKFVETEWKEAESEPRASRLKTRASIVDTYKGKLETSAGDLLEFCKDLMPRETDFLLNDYFKLCDLCETVRNGGKECLDDLNDAWKTCLFFLTKDSFYGVRKYEKEESVGTEKYKRGFWDGTTIFESYQDENGIRKDRPLSDSSYSTITKKIYRLHRVSFPYGLCSRLLDYYVEKDIFNYIVFDSLKRDALKDVFITFVKTVCLYIALTNEELRLQNPRTAAPTLAVKKKKMKWEDDTLTLAEKMKEWGEKVFTQRAISSFNAAIKQNWIKETWYGYEWTPPFANDDKSKKQKQHLVCFFIGIYEEDERRPPYEKLKIMFRESANLSDLATKLRGTKKQNPVMWYKEVTDLRKRKEGNGQAWYTKPTKEMLRRIPGLPPWYLDIFDFFTNIKVEKFT